jgi:hypothetical protein
MIRKPDRGPAALGVKITEISQSAPGARVLGQSLLCAKSPTTVIFEISSTEFSSGSLILTCLGLLVPPGGTCPKDKSFDETCGSLFTARAAAADRSRKAQMTIGAQDRVLIG